MPHFKKICPFSWNTGDQNGVIKKSQVSKPLPPRICLTFSYRSCWSKLKITYALISFIHVPVFKRQGCLLCHLYIQKNRNNICKNFFLHWKLVFLFILLQVHIWLSDSPGMSDICWGTWVWDHYERPHQELLHSPCKHVWLQSYHTRHCTEDNVAAVHSTWWPWDVWSTHLFQLVTRETRSLLTYLVHVCYGLTTERCWKMLPWKQINL